MKLSAMKAPAYIDQRPCMKALRRSLRFETSNIFCAFKKSQKYIANRFYCAILKIG